MYVNDFDDNGVKDIVLAYYNYGIQFPLRGFSCSSQQVPELRNKFQKYEYVLKVFIFLITINACCCIVGCPWNPIQIYCQVHVSMAMCQIQIVTPDIIQVQCSLLTETCHTCQAYQSWKMFYIMYCGFLPSVFHVTSSTRSVSVFVVRRAA